MTNKIKSALKAAIEALEMASEDAKEWATQYVTSDNAPTTVRQYVADKAEPALNQLKSALSEIEKREQVVWQYFDEAYKKAVESSEPDDWMNAALMAQQVRRKQLDTSPQPQNVEKCEPVANHNEAVSHLWESIGRWSAYIASNGEQAELSPPSWLIDAVRKATSPQPIGKCEPVAWMLDHIPNKGYMTITHIKDYADKEMGKTIKNNPNGFGQKYGCYPYDICIPLYDKPQPRDWVGLSESDIKELSSNLWVSGAINRDELAKVIEAKLKQLNTKG